MSARSNNGGETGRTMNNQDKSDIKSPGRVEQNIVEVPELHFHEKYAAVDIPVVQEKIRYEQKEIIQEREVHVVKPVIKEKIVEVPKYKVVEKVVEVPQVVIEEKLVEVERIEVSPKSRNATRPGTPTERKQLDIVTQYRQVPKPIEVPIAFYSAVPVPILIDRAVPVPMELQIIQDILCPKIEAIYKDIPIPIPVKRNIEKPVPIGLYDQPELLQKYLHDPDEPLPNPIAALEQMAQQANISAGIFAHQNATQTPHQQNSQE
ncbi:hypothetical protein FG379_000621 [Cryptosporidium bovis]|uniref:uncharacterized protein n=1 Tax=Cryptosporidium bovis TaxID=310047 RepID=UPI00351A7821|nr:hypothetical protein FG379_000621 [Cryptosporidium bovis]